MTAKLHINATVDAGVEINDVACVQYPKALYAPTSNPPLTN
eukprot:CAMPEP_0119034122 /NCGR_PEP_ID=MMETSP1177-20130426/1159_1 /TAXON_ID=2985 /ORGANISM="Ochromonas sp, Strain CCMP1899" /LENGTH=40 /DNA_ID= /DNA_START= /DNA_END= /DNA_ORIENTATION=